MSESVKASPSKSHKEKKYSSVGRYFVDSYQELRKVTWPTKLQAVRLTFLVLGFCLVVAVLVAIVDTGFSLGHQALLNMAPAGGTGSESVPVNINPGDITVEGETADGTPISGEATVTVPVESGDAEAAPDAE